MFSCVHISLAFCIEAVIILQLLIFPEFWVSGYFRFDLLQKNSDDCVLCASFARALILILAHVLLSWGFQFSLWPFFSVTLFLDIWQNCRHGVPIWLTNVSPGPILISLSFSDGLKHGFWLWWWSCIFLLRLCGRALSNSDPRHSFYLADGKNQDRFLMQSSVYFLFISHMTAFSVILREGLWVRFL